jgi:hypothetical protein
MVCNIDKKSKQTTFANDHVVTVMADLSSSYMNHTRQRTFEPNQSSLGQSPNPTVFF